MVRNETTTDQPAVPQENETEQMQPRISKNTISVMHPTLGQFFISWFTGIF